MMAINFLSPTLGKPRKSNKYVKVTPPYTINPWIKQHNFQDSLKSFGGAAPKLRNFDSLFGPASTSSSAPANNGQSNGTKKVKKNQTKNNGKTSSKSTKIPVKKQPTKKKSRNNTIKNPLF